MKRPPILDLRTRKETDMDDTVPGIFEEIIRPRTGNAVSRHSFEDVMMKVP